MAYGYCGVSVNTVRSYFQILEDTIVGRYLPAYVVREKRKVIHAPKFYLFNVAIVNNLSKRGSVLQGSAEFGKAFENWLFHELKAYISYERKDEELTYWRLADSGIEANFIVGDLKLAIEVKGKDNIQNQDLKGLREIEKEHPKKLKNRILVCLETKARLTEDGILILPYQEFLSRLWENDFI